MASASRPRARPPTGQSPRSVAANYGPGPRGIAVGRPAARLEATRTTYEGGPVSTILIGVDSSARSEDAIALGRHLAHAGAAQIVVATVTPSSHPDRDEAHLTVRRMSGLLAGVEAERIRTGVVA